MNENACIACIGKFNRQALEDVVKILCDEGYEKDFIHIATVGYGDINDETMSYAYTEGLWWKSAPNPEDAETLAMLCCQGLKMFAVATFTCRDSQYERWIDKETASLLLRFMVKGIPVIVTYSDWQEDCPKTVSTSSYDEIYKLIEAAMAK